MGVGMGCCSKKQVGGHEGIDSETSAEDCSNDSESNSSEIVDGDDLYSGEEFQMEPFISLTSLVSDGVLAIECEKEAALENRFDNIVRHNKCDFSGLRKDLVFSRQPPRFKT